MNRLKKEFQQWVATRPPIIQAAIAKFPPMTVLNLPKMGRCYVIGWAETTGGGVQLIVSEGDPRDGYDEAFAVRQYVCIEHITPEMRVGQEGWTR